MNLYEKALAKRLQEDNNKYEVYRKDSIAYMNETSQQSLNETRLAVMRSFEIDNLGIWNVDKIADNKSFVAFSLDFVDENNEPIDVDVIYLADKSFNSVFRYNVATKNKVLLNPYSNNMLWAVLPGNKLAIAGQQQLWKLAGTKGKQKITMKVSDDAVASIEEARAALNF
jgi:hypothetical protein